MVENRHSDKWIQVTTSCHYVKYILSYLPYTSVVDPKIFESGSKNLPLLNYFESGSEPFHTETLPINSGKNLKNTFLTNNKKTSLKNKQKLWQASKVLNKDSEFLDRQCGLFPYFYTDPIWFRIDDSALQLHSFESRHPANTRVAERSCSFFDLIRIWLKLLKADWIWILLQISVL